MRPAHFPPAEAKERRSTMASVSCSIETFPVTRRKPSARQERDFGGLRLFSPADPMTRLLMEADGVSAADLDALLHRLAAARQMPGWAA
jgi:hypothetical protein